MSILRNLGGIMWLWLIPLGAQTTGTIAGRVFDPNSASIPTARVSARQTETGATRVARTDTEGRYLLAALPAGEYELRAEAEGFRPLLHKGIRLNVGEQATVDFPMQIGGVDQEITVVGDAPLVNTRSSELSYLVSEEAIRELPLNGRNFTDLALLQPGVVAFPHRDGGSVVAHGLATSVNGADPRSNTYLLDGTPLNDFTNGPAGSAAGTVLGAETIREFRVESNAYSAEFGRTFGGQINAITKSGANAFHGSAYEFFRNDNFDARNFFDPARIPEFVRNQFGGTLGGPLRLDRSFFFVGYEGLRDRLGRTVTTIVPDLNARQGILPDPANPGATITVPVHPAVRPFVDEYPLPNGPSRGGGLADYAFLFRQRTDQDFFQTRFDQNLDGRQQLFARYTHDAGEQRLPTDYPQFPRTFLSRNQFATAEHRWILSPRTLHTLRANFSRTRIGQNVEANTSQALPAFVPGRGLVGSIDIGSNPRFGTQSSVNVQLVQNVFGFESQAAMTRGRHFLRLGGMVERYRNNMFNPTFSLGIYNFGDWRSFLENRPTRFVGLPPDGALDRYWRFTLFGMYVQDDWRASGRLTLNLGLRYEFSTLPVDIYGRDSALRSLSDAAPTVGPLYRNPTYRNAAPRFGFAWDVWGTGRLALRGGYGLFFNTNNQQNLIVTVTNPPATPRVIIANPTFPHPPFERGVGNSMRPVEWNLRNPYLQVWNLNLQQQLPFDSALTVGYAGSRGVHLLRSGDVNIPPPQRLADGTLFWPVGAPRPNPAFSTIELKKSDGNSWYQALLVEWRKRWSRGFNFQSSYTFARNIDTTQASTFFSDATNGTTSAFPEFPGFSYNKGLADFHAKHNWVANALWELPLGRGLTGVAGALARGWQIASIASLRSGSPLTAFVSRNRSRSQWSPSLGPGIGQDRPSMAPGRTHASAVRGGADQYLDPAAFVLQPAGTLGNLGRGALIGPNLRNVDFAVMKNFRTAWLGEDGNLQFRAEAFNLFNRPNLGIPQLTVFNGAADGEAPLAGFGRIRSTVTPARQIQLGLRLRF